MKLVMVLNISGMPLDENMLAVIARIPGRGCYLPLDVIEDDWVKMFELTGKELTRLLFNKQFMETTAYHEHLCYIKDVLDDINTIKNFQRIYSDAYKWLEAETKDDRLLGFSTD